MPAISVLYFFVYSLLQKHGIHDHTFELHPLDEKCIVLTGSEIELLKPEKSLFEQKFPRFQLMLTKRTFKQLGLKIEKKSTGEYRSPEWITQSCATIGLLVSARENNKNNPHPDGGVYAVAPAHLVLEPDQCQRYSVVGHPISCTREEVEKKTTCTRYAIELTDPHIDSNFDLSHPPLISYRYWFTTENEPKIKGMASGVGSMGAKISTCPIDPTSRRSHVKKNECHHIFMNDIALLSVDRENVCKIQEIIQQLQPPNVGKLMNITREHVNRLCRRKQKIAIGTASGELRNMSTGLYEVREQQDQKLRAVHFPFILTSKTNGETE